MDLPADLAACEPLPTGPYPAGAKYHYVELAEGGEYEPISRRRRELVRALAERWGPPRQVDLMEMFAHTNGPTTPLAEQIVTAEPELDVWDFPDRVVCVGIGQLDADEPIVLFAGAGQL